MAKSDTNDNDYKNVVRRYREAAQLNRTDPLLKQNLLQFPNYGQVVMTGDLHGSWDNFERIRTYCALDRYPQRCVVLHELLHSPQCDRQGRCFSFELLEQAVQWKLDYPEQVFFLMSNHDLAEATRHEISKWGTASLAALRAGMESTYGKNTETVHNAMIQFLRSEPLAARLPNRFLLSHSLPSQRNLKTFDPDVLHRPITESDLQHNGSVYHLLWGRGHTEAVTDLLAESWDVDFFVVGHVPQETGFDLPNPRQIILSSDHPRGCILPINAAKSYAPDDLLAAVFRLNDVPLHSTPHQPSPHR